MFNLPNALGMGSAASAAVFGALMAGRNLGALVGPILLPEVYSIFGQWGGVAVVFAGITMLAGVVAVVMMLSPVKAAERS